MTSEADTRANFIDPALASTGWEGSRMLVNTISPTLYHHQASH